MDNSTIDEPLAEAGETEKKRNPSWFKPGNNANPSGRPKKGYSITEAFKEMLHSQPEKKKAIVNKILIAALSGDMTASKLIWQYMDGMPKQEIEQTGELNLNVNAMLDKVYGGESESDSTI
jgi:hypothetical protein